MSTTSVVGGSGFFARSASGLGGAASGSTTPNAISGGLGAVNAPRQSPAIQPNSPKPAARGNPSTSATEHHHNHHQQVHHGNYDARLVASTINKIEAASGLGGASSGGVALTSSGSAGNAASQGGSASSTVTTGVGLPGDSEAWTAVCIRSLPLFNGEGQRGYLEDLNELVSAHVRYTIHRIGPNDTAISSLHSDLVDILAMGMLTLQTKLLNLTNDKLLIRITEVWNFFFIGCMPYIEGIFLPLRTDPLIRQISALSVSSSDGNDKRARRLDGIDIRKTALQSFRDHLVLPIVDKLALVFSAAIQPGQSLPLEPGTYANSTANIVPTARTAISRRLQMVSVLSSLQTGDERQAATDALARALRASMEKRESAHATDGATPLTLYSARMYGPAAVVDQDEEKKARRQGRHLRPSFSQESQVDFEHNANSDLFDSARPRARPRAASESLEVIPADKDNYRLGASAV